jgi:hypothetical protein
MMRTRTTWPIDDDLLQKVKEYAAARNLSEGRAANEVLRRGFSRPFATTAVDGLHLPVLPEDSPVVTSQRVREMLEDE